MGVFVCAMTLLRPICAALLAALAVLPPGEAAADSLAGDFSGLEDIRSLAGRYCFACHSAQTKSGGIDLKASLLRDPHAAPRHWKTALDMLRAGKMPTGGGRHTPPRAV